MNRVFISRANPLKLVPETVSKAAAYNTTSFDDQLYFDRIFAWDEQQQYLQKWQTTDSVRLQFIANFNPINIELLDDYNNVIINVIMTQKAADVNNPGFYVYESDISLASVPQGCYRFKFTFGSGGDVYYSEPISVMPKHEQTVYIEYRNSIYKDGIIYETGFSPAIRIEGSLGRLSVGTKEQMWEDQPLNQTIINSKTYRIWPFHVGFNYGVPDWLLDKLNIIFSNDYTSIDGQLFVKSDAGAAFEETAIDGYPLRGFKINLRESINRTTNIIDSDIDTDRKVVVIHNIETNLFGDLSSNAATNQVPVIGYE